MSKSDMRQVLAIIVADWIASGHTIKRLRPGRAWKYGFLNWQA